MIIVKDKAHHMVFQLIEVLVKITFCCVLLQDPIRHFNMAICPRVLEFRKSMLNMMFLANSIKRGIRTGPSVKVRSTRGHSDLDWEFFDYMVVFFLCFMHR